MYWSTIGGGSASADRPYLKDEKGIPYFPGDIIFQNNTLNNVIPNLETAIAGISADKREAFKKDIVGIVVSAQTQGLLDDKYKPTRNWRLQSKQPEYEKLLLEELKRITDKYGITVAIGLGR